jgi:predicted GH43/DUF377 family glycosyl hydrolase
MEGYRKRNNYIFLLFYPSIFLSLLNFLFLINTCLKRLQYIAVSLFMIFALGTMQAAVNLEERPHSFVLETKRIEIPAFPRAFNPSILRLQGRLLLSFRNIANPKDSYNSSEIGLVWLDDDFQISSAPQILKLSETGIKRAEDGRLIEVDGRLMMIYSDNEDEKITKGGFRVYVAELGEKEGKFYVKSKNKLTEYEGKNDNLREKNWTPFSYNEELHLSYSLNPHLVFKPLNNSSISETVALSDRHIPFWIWGELRGGTQTLKIDDQYVTFFHTAIKMATEHSDNKEMLHYFMGAAIFDTAPPFSMTYISKEPIIGAGFFTGQVHKQYWGSWRGIFPGGFICDREHINIVYGRQNCEIWVVTLDKKGLIDSLVPLSSTHGGIS